jgi:hypothetical protein
VRSVRIALALAGAASLCASAIAIAPAVAQAPRLAKLKIVGSLQLKPGQFVKDDQRFAPRDATVRSGGRVRLRNRADTEDPHTISLVRRADLPRTPDTVFA